MSKKGFGFRASGRVTLDLVEDDLGVIGVQVELGWPI